MRMRTCLMREARVHSCTRTPTRALSGMRAGMACDGMDNMHACELRAHPHALSCTGRGAAAGSAAPVAPFGTSSTASLGCAPDAPFGASFAALHVCSPFFGAHAGAPHAAARARARRRCRRGTHNLWPRRSGARDGCAPLRRSAPRGARAQSPWRLKLACLLACLLAAVRSCEVST